MKEGSCFLASSVVMWQPASLRGTSQDTGFSSAECGHNLLHPGAQKPGKQTSSNLSNLDLCRTVTTVSRVMTQAATN